MNRRIFSVYGPCATGKSTALALLANQGLIHHITQDYPAKVSEQLGSWIDKLSFNGSEGAVIKSRLVHSIMQSRALQQLLTTLSTHDDNKPIVIDGVADPVFSEWLFCNLFPKTELLPSLNFRTSVSSVLSDQINRLFIYAPVQLTKSRWLERAKNRNEPILNHKLNSAAIEQQIILSMNWAIQNGHKVIYNSGTLEELVSKLKTAICN